MTRLLAFCLVVGALSRPMIAVEPEWPTVGHFEPVATIRAR